MEKILAKEEIVETLQESIDGVRQAVMATTDADLETQVQFFGRGWTTRELFSLAATHMHEHLEQAVVYARSSGVVPPWSQPAPDEEE